MKECNHLEDILKYERNILKDKNKKAEYIRKHGESMREMYCGHVCDSRYKCELAQKYLPETNHS